MLVPPAHIITVMNPEGEVTELALDKSGTIVVGVDNVAGVVPTTQAETFELPRPWLVHELPLNIMKEYTLYSGKKRGIVTIT